MDIPSLPMNYDRNQGGQVTFGSDEKLFAQFHKMSVLNGIKSKEAGRPVHDAVAFVKIQQPGERDYLDRPATMEDRMRFPRQWAAYEAGQEDIPDGTLLSVLFPNNPEVVDNLKYAKILTVEQLASCNDTQIQNLGLGGRTFVDRAKAYLAASEKGKGFHELSARLEQLELQGRADKDRIAALETALAAAGEELPDQPKRRGRPPKAVAA
jgi:hypothetical protein